MAMTTGQIMKCYRERMGLSQESVAEFLKIKREQLSYFETDSRETPLEILEKLSNLYGANLADFFEEDQFQVKTNVAFAFRADEVVEDDLEKIADFRKIVKNYFKILKLENE